MVHGRRLGTAVLLVAVGALAACGSNDYQYVNNASERTFFKVPSDWKVLRVETDEITDRPVAEQTGPRPWHVVFDADEEPDAAHASDEVPPAPVGQALIFQIDPSQGDRLSPADLRAAFLGSDPLEATDDDVEVLDFEQLVEDGLRGSRVRYNQRTSGGDWVTIDHSSLINATGDKVYVFEVKAPSATFDAESRQLSQIVDSFQVRS